jgi:uncharacterized protein YkwD
MYLRLSVVLTALLFSCFSCTTEEAQTPTLEESIQDEVVVNMTAQEAELFDMINTHRESKNLNTLVFDGDAYIEASDHTEYMIKTGHNGHANFNERAKNISAKKPVKFVAENVGDNFKTIDEAFKAWLNSSGHKENLEGNYTHSAISVKKDKNDKLFFTQIFFR